MPLTPARFPSGISTARAQDFLADFGKENPFLPYSYINDFSTYGAADWTVSTVNGGTTALQDGPGGQLILTTGGTSTNFQGNTLAIAPMQIKPGYRSWFLINILMADALGPNFLIGMTTGGPSAPTAGVYFTKATATRSVSAVVRAASTSTTMTGVATMVDAKAITLGWYYDGKAGSAGPNLYFWASDNQASPQAYTPYTITGGQLKTAATSLANLPSTTTNLAPQFYVVTNSAAAKTLVVDYMLVGCELPRY